MIASLCNDPLNKQVADTCGKIWGYGHGYMVAIAAEFWKPMASKRLPDGYVIHDTNIDGPRGVTALEFRRERPQLRRRLPG